MCERCDQIKPLIDAGRKGFDTEFNALQKIHEMTDEEIEVADAALYEAREPGPPRPGEADMRHFFMRAMLLVEYRRRKGLDTITGKPLEEV